MTETAPDVLEVPSPFAVSVAIQADIGFPPKPIARSWSRFFQSCRGLFDAAGTPEDLRQALSSVTTTLMNYGSTKTLGVDLSSEDYWLLVCRERGMGPLIDHISLLAESHAAWYHASAAPFHRWLLDSIQE
jgi:hypothetical protein